MTSAPTNPTIAPPTLPEVAAALMAALAEIRAMTVDELEVERAGGDLELASSEAVAAIAAVEHRFGRLLAKVEDLEPEQLTSLDDLADLLHRRWPAGTPVTAGGES
jgi:hypothetical protein